MKDIGLVAQSLGEQNAHVKMGVQRLQRLLLLRVRSLPRRLPGMMENALAWEIDSRQQADARTQPPEGGQRGLMRREVPWSARSRRSLDNSTGYTRLRIE